MCAVCPGAAGLFAVWIAPKIGLNTPSTEKGRQTASLLTALTTAVTVLAFKVFFQFSLCGGSGSLLYRFAVASVKVIPLALAYGLIFNILIGNQEKKESQARSSCCSHKIQKNKPIV